MANLPKPSSFRAQVLLFAGLGCLLWGLAPRAFEQRVSEVSVPPSNTVRTTAKVLQVKKEMIAPYGMEICPLLNFVDGEGKSHQSWGPCGVNSTSYERGETLEIYYTPGTKKVVWTDRYANDVRATYWFMFWVSKIIGAFFLISTIGLACAAETYQDMPRSD